MVMIKYGFFDVPFLLPKYPLLVLVSLGMAWQVALIENKYTFGGNFKMIYPCLIVVGIVIMLEVDCTKNILHFIVGNFNIFSLKSMDV